MKKAPDPLKTDPPIGKRELATYNAIAARLATLNPKIVIAEHIAQSDRTQLSTLQAMDSTLDGINFIAVDPAKLKKEFEGVKDTWDKKALASVAEDPEHWALKLSFASTKGTGWREKWRPAPYSPPGIAPEQAGRADDMMRMRFGTAGSPFDFSALHCAVQENGWCNVHIDRSGFVLELPYGFSLTPDLYGHIVNELLLKTDLRDWFDTHIANATARGIVHEVFRRTSLIFPNAANGYAGLDRRIKGLRQPTGVLNGLLTTGKFLAPTGVTFDLYETDTYKVQATGAFDEPSFTITIGGRW